MQLLGMVMMVVGLFFLFAGAIGMLRFPDVFSRSHAVGLTDAAGRAVLPRWAGPLSGPERQHGPGAGRAGAALSAQPGGDARDAASSAQIRHPSVAKGRSAMTYTFELVLVLLVLATAFAAIFVKDLISCHLPARVVQLLPRPGLGLARRRRPRLRRGRGRRWTRHRLPADGVVAGAPGGHHHPADAAAAHRLPGPGGRGPAPDLRRPGSSGVRRSGTPANMHIAPTYLENSVADSRTPNVVTAIIMDYRGFDTLIETCVIFAAGIACAAIVGKR